MTIKLACKNNHTLEVKEYLLRENPEEYRICPYCQEKLQVMNVAMIVKEDLSEQVKNNLDLWFIINGVEATIELIERSKKWLPEKIYNLYAEEIKRRGLKVK